MSNHPLELDLGQVTGLSAYQVWLAQGNTGSVSDFFATLKGDKGDPASALDIMNAFDDFDKVDTEVRENSNNLVTSDAVWRHYRTYGSMQYVKHELHENSEVTLIPHYYNAIVTDTMNVVPTLKLPFDFYVNEDGEEVEMPIPNDMIISIRSVDGSGAQYIFDLDEAQMQRVFIDDGATSANAEGGAILLRAEYDGYCWYLHKHAYRSTATRRATLILSGKNQFGKHYKYNDTHIIEANINDSFTIKVSDYADEKWNYLFGNKCELLGWTDSLQDSTTEQANVKYAPDHIFELSDEATITLYPIYRIIEHTLTTQQVLTVDNKYLDTNSDTLIGGMLFDIDKVVKDEIGATYSPADDTASYAFASMIEGQIYGTNAETYTLKGSYSGRTLRAFLTNVGKGVSTTSLWLHDNTASGNDDISDKGKRYIHMYAKATGATADYVFRLKKIRIGYNRYNHEEWV